MYSNQRWIINIITTKNREHCAQICLVTSMFLRFGCNIACIYVRESDKTIYFKRLAINPVAKIITYDK